MTRRGTGGESREVVPPGLRTVWPNWKAEPEILKLHYHIFCLQEDRNRVFGYLASFSGSVLPLRFRSEPKRNQVWPLYKAGLFWWLVWIGSVVWAAQELPGPVHGSGGKDRHENIIEMKETSGTANSGVSLDCSSMTPVLLWFGLFQMDLDGVCAVRQVWNRSERHGESWIKQSDGKKQDPGSILRTFTESAFSLRPNGAKHWTRPLSWERKAPYLWWFYRQRLIMVGFRLHITEKTKEYSGPMWIYEEQPEHFGDIQNWILIWHKFNWSTVRLYTNIVNLKISKDLA